MTELQTIPLMPNQLWTPNANYVLDSEYPTPTTDELCELWAEHTGTDVLPTPGVYGAMRMPEAPPTAYVSLDVCEVVRHTHLGIQAVEHPSEHIATYPVHSIHDYAENCSFKNYKDITSVAQVLIGAELIEPVEDIDQINELVQRWRTMGAYIMANTSTLPGCEPGTIKFFNHYMPGAFDALLLPRNHDSNKDQPTKGTVAADLMLAVECGTFSPDSLAEETDKSVVAIHIDDKSCHNQAFREVMIEIGGLPYTLQPEYPSHLEFDHESISAKTPLAAFQVADAILRNRVELTQAATNS